MYYRKIWRAAAVLSGIVLLTGCEQMEEEEWTPQRSAAVSIDLDGTVTEYLSEELDQSYYSFEELHSMLTSEASSYNAEHGDGSVTVTSAGQEEKRVNLVITYASGEDYAEFNHVQFYYGSMLGAQMEGYLFDGSYRQVEDGIVQGGEVSGSEVLKHMADMVVVVQAPLEVHVPGSVTFTSTGGTVLSAETAAAEEADSEEVSSGEAAGTSGQETADLYYIIFDDAE